jgi:hypothetical protein
MLERLADDETSNGRGDKSDVRLTDAQAGSKVCVRVIPDSNRRGVEATCDTPSPAPRRSFGGSKPAKASTPDPADAGHATSWKATAGELQAIPIRNRLFDLSLEGWETWAVTIPSDPSRQAPRFEAYTGLDSQRRVLAGRSALRVFSEPGKSYEAGVRQQVSGIPAGTPLRFVAHGHLWASSGDDPGRSEGMGRANLRVGIDPTGGLDPLAGSVVWSPPADAWDEYEAFEVEAVASAEAVTLFLYSRPSLCLEHNETFWDNAALFATGPAIPLDAPGAKHVQQSSRLPHASLLETLRSALRRSPPNLLRNPAFDEGFYYASPEIAVPQEWEFWHADESTPKLPRQDTPFLRPEAAVWHVRDATRDEKAEYFDVSNCCWRVRGSWRPVWARLQQGVSGLTPGEAYRFTVHFYPNLVLAFGPEGPRFAPDGLAGEHRLSAFSGRETRDTGWKNGREVPFGELTALSLDFTAADTAASLALEVRGRWALANTGWLIAGAELTRHS